MSKSKLPEFTEVVTDDLRALLFWACIGVAKSTGGSYRDIDHILESYAESLRFKLPYKPEFDSFAVWLKKREKKRRAA